jgi:phosphatidate cytidylyltransferase
VKPKSDLKVRTMSAIVMAVVAGGALWIGGTIFTVFVAAISLGIGLEYWGLVRKITGNWWSLGIWIIVGILYLGIASLFIISIRNGPSASYYEPHPLENLAITAQILLTVIFVDIGAYFVGRTFGGPKIAPSISPSKTWSGLIGGMLFASIAFGTFAFIQDRFTRGDAAQPDSIYGTPFLSWTNIAIVSLLVGSLIAVVAQAGDFFESWMKRRAGVKDSGNLIPGHGGIFDRADGIIAVAFVFGFLMLIARLFEG